MTQTMDAHPERHEDDRCIVFLNDGKMGGIQLHGAWQDDVDAMASLFIHLKAIFQSNGQTLEIHTIGDRRLS